MPHPSEHEDPRRPLGAEEAAALAGALQAFATASRLRLLWALHGGERAVDDLVTEVGLSQSAVSHQLRVLREARLVTVRREGRRSFYRLHDHHVPDLLDAMRHHHDHVLGLGAEDELEAARRPTAARP